MRLSLLKCLSLVAFVLLGATNISWISNHSSEISEAAIVKRIGNFFSENVVASGRASLHTALYDSLQLNDKGLSAEAFNYALEGYEKLKEEGALTNESVITIVDFDQPSHKKRMYVIDVENGEILFNTWAAHGRGTGRETAQSFSNTPESHKSSLGFYVTSNTYYGSKGYSMRLIGLEKNLNHNALSRAIVMHGASYVSQSFINAQGYIGRSHGCPAVPQELNRPIIDKIKHGSVLFIYNKSYKPSQKFTMS